MSLKYFLLSCLTCSFAFSLCNQLALDKLDPPKGFKHRTNSALTWLAPHHSSSDILTTVSNDIEINAKFSYGPLGTDLIGEEIELWADTCGEKLKLLGTFDTDLDGRIKHSLKSDMLPKEGIFKIWARVTGDSTITTFTLRILKAGTKLVVFDIDGTLTLSNIDQNLRIGSTEVTQKLKAAGFEILYLTGRHYLLTNYTRQLLEDNNFASGSLVLGQSLQEIIPNITSVGEFKANKLLGYKQLGFILDRAYGNDTTDIYAYLKAGIPLQRTYILGVFGGNSDTIALGEDFRNHLDFGFLAPTDLAPG